MLQIVKKGDYIRNILLKVFSKISVFERQLENSMINRSS